MAAIIREPYPHAVSHRPLPTHQRATAALSIATLLAVAACAEPALGQIGTIVALQVDGRPFGYFQSVSNIGSQSAVVERTANRTDPTRSDTKQAGDLKWNDVVLRRAVSDNLDVWNWRQQVVDGDVAAARHNFSITLQDANFHTIARWEFLAGWPSKLAVKLPADADAPLEELVLTHEGVQRVQ